MRAPILASVILLGLSVLGISAAAAQTDSTGASRYELTDLSAFETGCFGPCECPIFTRPLKGMFYLRHVATDPLFEYYEVRSVQWTVTDATSNTVITGSGTYKVGGEVAIQQQMSLDLSIGGGEPRHYDSGLVPGEGDFRKMIRINVSLHQNQACLDTLMHIDAVDPAVTSVDAESNSTSGFHADVAPNPFRNVTDIRLFLGRSAPLRVRIYDIHGRTVRHLAAGSVVSAGYHSLSWDGRADQGSTCAAGIYFVDARAGVGQTLTRVVKLR